MKMTDGFTRRGRASGSDVGGWVGVLTAVFFLACVPVAAPGQDNEGLHPDHPDYVDKFDRSEDEWTEDGAAFPNLPRDQDLVRFEVPGSDFVHFIDTRSLSLGKDEVLRYTVVVEAGGARNILYEGIRCETREFRSLGYAAGTQGFKPRRGGPWRHMFATDGGANRFRWVLWDQYLCDASGQWMPVKAVLARLSRHLGETSANQSTRGN